MINKELILKEIEIINKRIEEISQESGLRMSEASKIIYSDLCNNRMELYKKLKEVI